MHSLLKRQVKLHFGDESSISEELRKFLEAVDSAYGEFDSDRGMLERSLDLSSQELLQANAEIRARADEALRKSEARLAEAQAIAGLGSWEWDITGNTIVFSDQAFNLFGQPEDAVVTQAPFQDAFQSFLASVHADDRDAVVRNLWQAIQTGETTDQEYRLVRPDGEQRWVHEVGRASFDEMGKPLRMASTIQDITERKRIQEQLDRYFDISLDAMAVAGLDGYLKRVNPTFARSLGYTDEEVLAVPYLDFVHADDRERTAAEVMKLATGVPAVDFEIRLCTKDGSYRWIQWNAMLSPPDQLLYATGRDVTERKEMEEALRERGEQLTQAQALARLGYWHWDILANKVTWSDELYGIFGLTPDQFDATFEGYLECVHPDDRRGTRETVEKALSDQQPFTFEERVVRPDGDIRDLYSQGEVVADDEGRSVSMMGICQDITVRRQAEEALRRETLFVKLLQIVAVNANLADSVDETFQITVDVICRHTGWPVGHVYLPAADDPDVLEPTGIWSSETSWRFAK